MGTAAGFFNDIPVLYFMDFLDWESKIFIDFPKCIHDLYPPVINQYQSRLAGHSTIEFDEFPTFSPPFMDDFPYFPTKTSIFGNCPAMFENSMDQVDQGIYTPQHPDGIVFAGSSLVRAAWRFGVFEEMDTGEWPPKNMCILCEKRMG